MNDQEYIKNLPAKRMASGVVVFNNVGEILLVKPTYKNHWSVPGGVIDKDESPRDAALREVKEEIGIWLKSCQLLCIDYMSPKDSGYSTKDENIQFIFYGGELMDEQISQIRIPQEEISECKFVSKEESLRLVGDKLANRLSPCFEAISNNMPVYLEGGKKYE
ncbi:MAG: NUDIX hydrolase [uncultured bacterium]|nr:MAG: NUDIX hydrolase [uncultured bacterium]HBR71500.1 NUDIX hydrolase [Candidatus Moranbacteria bacterium]